MSVDHHFDLRDIFRRLCFHSGTLLRQVLIGFIRLYQRLFSGLLGRNCRFYPTCSSYAVDALTQYRIHRAIPCILYRILRCNPFSKGGYDPIFPEGD